MRVKATGDEQVSNKDYFFRVYFGKELELKGGLHYTTLIDHSITQFPVDVFYDGTIYPNLKKLRFQATSIKQK